MSSWQEHFPPTHYFLYKKVEFPFNLDLFKYSSANIINKISTNPNSTLINLLPEDQESKIELSNETIQSFIKASQSFPTTPPDTITSENVLGINFLANEYEVDRLKTETEKYISEHQDELFFSILSFYEKCPDHRSKLEEIIADNLNLYLNQEQFKSLSIPILYRIIESYFNKQGQQVFDENTNLQRFLFDYLESNGIQASILFTHINFGKLPISYQQKLLNMSPQNFNFTYINQSFTQSTYEMNNEMMQNLLTLNSMKQSFSQFQEETNAQIQDVVANSQKREQQLQQQISQLNNELKTMKSTIDNVYPIGSIYMSVNNTNPEALFGGTWETWGQGRVPVGVSEEGTFQGVEQTGGSETHTLNLNEIPSHDGHVPNAQPNFGDCNENTYYIYANSGCVCQCQLNGPFVHRGNALCIRSFEKGGSQPHSILQPYITCYMWKRTG